MPSVSPVHDLVYQLRPDQVGKLGVQDRFWRLDFLTLYLQRIDEVRCDDPAASYQYAQALEHLLPRIPVDPARHGFTTRAEAERWRLYSRLVFASSCRASGRLKLSALVFADVCHALAALPATAEPWLRGHYHLRFGVFCLHQGDHSAEAQFHQALGFFERVPSPEGEQGLASTFNARGALRFHQGADGAAADFAAALRLYDRTTPGGRIRFDNAQINFLTSLSTAPLADCAAALGDIVMLREQMPRSGLRELYIRWSEARLRARLRLYSEAARSLERLRLSLLKKSGILDFALASLDLLQVLADAGEGEKAARLHRATVRRLRDHAAGCDLAAELADLPLERPVLERQRVRWRSAVAPDGAYAPSLSHH